MRIAQGLNLSEADQRELFYAALVKDSGCSSTAARLCTLFGADDLQLKADRSLIDWTSLGDLLGFLRRGVEPAAGAGRRLRRFAHLCATGQSAMHSVSVTRCEQGAHIVQQMGFSDSIATTVFALDEHWDGSGQPRGLRKYAIPLHARILCLAQTAEVFFTAGGPAQLEEVVRNRAGSWFDPHLVEALLACTRGGAFYEALGQPDVLRLVATVEPGEALVCDGPRLDAIAEALAEVVDAKSPYTGRHSREVAAAADAGARAAQFSPAASQELHRAALLHDLGKLGVPNTILDKPGKLTPQEWDVMRQHPAGTERILAPVPALRSIAAIAAAHHERLDGSGYHRGVPAGELPFSARLLAAADIYAALAADRPYRQGMSPDEVHTVLRQLAGNHLDPAAVDVLISGTTALRTAAA
jgi:HD-GYP domain-containing protein (c-di-GMP phosphodiesterase class II)